MIKFAVLIFKTHFREFIQGEINSIIKLLMARLNVEWSFYFSQGRNVPAGGSLARLATSSTHTFVYASDKQKKENTSVNRTLRQEYETILRPTENSDE